MNIQPSEFALRLLALCYYPSDVPCLSEKVCHRILKSGVELSSAVGMPELQAICTEREQWIISIRAGISDSEVINWLNILQRESVCVITIDDIRYPVRLRIALKESAPLALFCVGNIELVQGQSVSLVGTRDLLPSGKLFAEQVGEQCRLQKRVYCSGGARGADSVGFQANRSDGSAVLFLPDHLIKAAKDARYLELIRENRLLLVSESGATLGFSAARALSRNRLIHAFSECVFVAQSHYKKGGTWKGTTANLRHGWSNVFINDDDNLRGNVELIKCGGTPISINSIIDFSELSNKQLSVF